jgi:hypothetical protein
MVLLNTAMANALKDVYPMQDAKSIEHGAESVE